MTPSFLFRDRAEQLLYALAPQRVHTALRERSTYTWNLLHGACEIDPTVRHPSLRVIEAWKTHVKRCLPEALIERCAREGIEILFRDDPRWPHALADLEHHQPHVLFLRGQLPTQLSIGVIGTRRPSDYGARATNHIISQLQQSNTCIVSGLALGTDGLAHRAALTYNLPTVAVLGTSVDADHIYPFSHSHLSREIIEHGGGLISEAPPGSVAHGGSFPERNRIIAALARALIVVEAHEKSGTLITTRMAFNLGRDVLAVPGSIFSSASIGTNGLLSAGATPYTQIQDVWNAMKLDAPTNMSAARRNLSLNPDDRALLTLLEAASDGLSPDALNKALETESASTISRLGMLELQGLVRQTFGGNWVAC